MKVKAGALYYALFICFLILSFIGIILLSGTYQSQYLAKFEINNRLKRNIESSIVCVLANNYNNLDAKKNNLFRDQDDTVSIDKMNWGGYNVFKIKAYHGSLVKTKCFLLGARPIVLEKYALILKDNQLLTVGGNSTIEGGVNFKEAKIKEVVFEGLNPSVAKNISSINNPSLEIRSEFKSFIGEIYKKVEEGNLIQVGEFEENKIVENSFANATIFIYDDSSIDLSNCRMEGNIIIVAKESIIIRENTDLNNVIIISPKIIVKDGFKGCCQLYANNTLSVGRNCHFNYPSILGCINVHDLKSNGVFIDRNSIIEGGVIVCGHTPKVVNKANIEINGQVNGIVHSDGYVQHKGKILGAINCNGLVLLTESGVYKNHLVNAEINCFALNKLYSEPIIYDKQNDLEIIDWLN